MKTIGHVMCMTIARSVGCNNCRVHNVQTQTTGLWTSLYRLYMQESQAKVKFYIFVMTKHNIVHRPVYIISVHTVTCTKCGHNIQIKSIGYTESIGLTCRCKSNVNKNACIVKPTCTYECSCFTCLWVYVYSYPNTTEQ